MEHVILSSCKFKLLVSALVVASQYCWRIGIFKPILKQFMLWCHYETSEVKKHNIFSLKSQLSHHVAESERRVGHPDVEPTYDIAKLVHQNWN